jgi:UDP-N-acetylglucosamine 2-epimerase
MLAGLEEVMLNDKPDWVLVYGDTNSTLAGALAAVKLQIPVAHVEAGLRSFNRQMPEEHNRVLTDHAADRLFCPTLTAVRNLARENIVNNVYLVGDTMFDAVLQFSELACQRSTILERLALEPREYILATIHRPYNTDVPENLQAILTALLQLDAPVVFPVHPRTRKCIEQLDMVHLEDPGLRLIDPVGYLDMLVLEKNSRLLLTDSGGMQKEAYFFEVPCVTLRPETEWIETVEVGWNRLAGADTAQIVAAAQDFSPQNHHPALYGDGHAARKIAEQLVT